MGGRPSVEMELFLRSEDDAPAPGRHRTADAEHPLFAEEDGTEAELSSPAMRRGRVVLPQPDALWVGDDVRYYTREHA